MLLDAIQASCSSSLKSRQLVSLQKALEHNRANGQRTALIVDNADRLSLELLEEIRLLLNMESAQEKLLDIVLVGGSEFIRQNASKL
jgi:type II secretory pathway predicted ATPase ExeA